VLIGQPVEQFGESVHASPPSPLCSPPPCGEGLGVGVLFDL
jgi:hypothetical protein